MKKPIQWLLVILALGAIAGIAYWQQHKKRIIKASITSTVEKKTDSLYHIRYDSADINELNASASFFNVVLQADSTQKNLLRLKDSLPNALFHIRVEAVMAKGVDVPGLLQNRTFTARSITLIKPVVHIINTGADKPKPFTQDDSLQLYQKILGNYTSIRADSITVVNGTLLITNINGKSLTTAEDINIFLPNFLIDSTRNYQHVISYFIKDVQVSVNNIQLPETDNHTRVNIGKLLYDAPAKKLEIGHIQQYKMGNTDALADLKKIVFHELNTDRFIVQRKLKAGLLSCAGGSITVYRKKKTPGNSTEKAISLSSDFIDAVQIAAIETGNTDIIVNNADDPGSPPFIINGVQCSANNINPVTEGSTLSSLLEDANWQITATGFSFLSKEKHYRFNATGLVLHSNGVFKATQVSIKPQLSEAAFGRKMKKQKDRYDLAFNNINIEGLKYKDLLGKNTLEITSVTMEPLIKIYNDRTLAPDQSIVSKNFPHHDLLKLKFPVYLEKIIVKKGAVYYKERGEKSGRTGTPNFTSINAVLSNVTNMPSKIALNSRLQLKASSLFLGVGKIETEWILPLKLSDTVFTVTGSLGAMDGTVLNSVSKPLAMVAVKEGKINSLVFSMQGSTYKGTGNVTFLYNGLKVEALKMKEDELKRKGLATFLANTMIKNNNPANGNMREGKIDHDRDVRTSFFNLIWKSIFSGVKSTAL
jgi:hypothetical protein